MRICWRAFITQRLSQNRSAAETSRLLRREMGKPWAGRSIHTIGKRDVVEVISAIVQRGAPGAANKTLKSLKTFLRWCVGQAVLDRSPAEGVPLPDQGSRSRPSPGRYRTRPGHPCCSKNRWSIWCDCRAFGAHRTAARGSRLTSVGGVGLGSTDLDNSQNSNKECQGAHRPSVEASIGRSETRRPARATRFHTTRNQAFPGFQLMPSVGSISFLG